MKQAKRERMVRLTLRAGIMMTPREPGQRQERVKRDHTVLVLPTTLADGERGYSFLRGGPAKEKWTVRADDVDERDFLDHPEYIDTSGGRVDRA